MKLKENKTYTIDGLTEDDIKWLHEVMQNPLHGEHPLDEDESNRFFRSRMFEATDIGGNNNG